MEKLIVIKDFKGSTTGSDVVKFKLGQKVTSDELGEDLMNVALEEEWIDFDEDDDDETVSLDKIINAINELDKEDESLWAKSGSPKVGAIEGVLGSDISGGARDAAWAAINAE